MDFSTPVTLLLQANVRDFVSPLRRPKVGHIAMRRPVLGEHEDVSAYVAFGDNLVDGMLMDVYRAFRQEGDSDCTYSGCYLATIQHGIPKYGQLNNEITN